MRGIPNTIVDEASEYVQEHARYTKSPCRPYAVRHPTRENWAFFSHDTWDLVEQLARHLNTLRLRQQLTLVQKT